MIKGDINNVLQWLDMNGIQQWTIFQGSGANGQGKIFESNIEMSMESEIERFRQVMALSENALVKIVGKVNPKQNTGVFVETWTNSSPAQSHSMSIGSTPMYDADFIDSKIKAAVAEERMIWREKELVKRENNLAEAEKEFKRNQEGIVGILIEKAAPFISQIMPQSAVAGVKSPTPVEPIPVKTMTVDEAIEEAREEDPEIFTDEEADRLMAAMARFKEVDADYLIVVEKIVEIASGKPVSVMNIHLDYNTIKGYILNS